MKAGILAIDQGTTSSRAIVFSKQGEAIATAQQEFTQHFPQNGWVEHEPNDIWNTTLACCKQAIEQASLKGFEVSCIGISNQRETTLVWNKQTGECIHRAIVWQDRRTANFCDSLKAHEANVTRRTGLLLDPYFSASKIRWILDHVDGARDLAEQGLLSFGTVDTYLIWKLSGNKAHCTDATNASRTSLFNIHTQQWDDELLDLFGVPKSMLPTVKDSSADFAVCDTSLFGRAIPVTGVAGDQQAALFGQSCFQPGDIKSTYGTGCFALLNTGTTARTSQNKLLTTVAYRLNGAAHYALEGAIFTAGANIQWLRDGLSVIDDAAQSEALAKSLDYDHGVYLVPAFTGLGAPHWSPNARASVFGMTRDTGRAHFVRAALEAVCFQTNELITAMQDDGASVGKVWLDGGMVHNAWMCQFLSDILQREVVRPTVMESSALGAAYLAGLAHGIYKDTDEIAAMKEVKDSFHPDMQSTIRDDLLNNWSKAVAATLAFAK